MLSFEQAQEALTESADRLPEQIFRELNGGIILLPDTVINPESKNNDLLTLGRYFYHPHSFGRYIEIYYGSFQRVYGTLPDYQQKQKLEEILYHELTHHLEHLAGDRSLEIKDAIFMQKYRKRKDD